MQARPLTSRHCERSEAIQNRSAEGLWIASSQELLAMTEQGATASLLQFHFHCRHSFASSRLISPELCVVVSPSVERGRREGREPVGSHGRLCTE